MLVSLHVKNLALIDETEVFFGKGLNILSGETGAGKSIIIGSINLALGARADKDLIRHGSEYALVELIFQVDTPEQEIEIRNLDIPIEDDGTIIIQRKIMATRNICKIGGELAPTKLLKELAAIFIDIHGQHEHQSLLYKKIHFQILDNFSGDELEKVVIDIKKTYLSFIALTDKLELSTLDEETRRKEISFAEFEVREIDEVSLKEGEDLQLELQYKKMSSSKKVLEGLSNAYLFMNQEQGIHDEFGRIGKELKNISDYDESLLTLWEEFIDIESMINDFSRSISSNREDFAFSDEEYLEVEERLNLINKLKLKYGNAIKDILHYQEEKQLKLEELLNFKEYQQKIQEKLINTQAELVSLSNNATEIRKKYALILQTSMKQALEELNFLTVDFEIQVRDKGEFTEKGRDEVEFMISTNPGEKLKPLGNVASGGELSRIMLALKTVLARKDQINTLIFDEIDAGISGKTAWKVSEKLGELSKNHQVICITHLPQIAAMADTHFVIKKESNQTSTTTTIKEIKNDEMIEELARLLGTDEITMAVIENAKELKDLAIKTKK